MIESFIALIILFIIWAFCIYHAEMNFELKIKPLHDLKRKCLVNMSRRRAFEKTNDENGDITKDSEVIDNTLEKDNLIMQNISKVIFKFNIKLIIMFILLMIITSVVMIYSHLEISEIIIFLIAGISVIYLIAKSKSSNEDIKIKSLEIIKKKFDLSDEYIKIIKGE